MRFRLTAAVLIGFVVVICALIFFGPIRLWPPNPAIYPVAGIDVSHHQGPIEWRAVAASGVRFAFIKATEGRDFLDPRFEFNWRAARQQGLPRGAYHFFTFCSPGLDQAANFLRVAPPEEGALAPVADVEFGGNCSSYGDLERVREELMIFLTEVEGAWGRKPILYLTARSRRELIDDRFGEFPLWLRNIWGRMREDGRTAWTLWQYTDDGQVPGIDGPVDKNVLHPEVSVVSLQVVR